jgi:UPF0042 nucleotide-binding protein
MQITIVSGLSGSGKSVALHVLEDAGCYCVDNLPLTLLPELAAHLRAGGQRRVAIAVDVRGGESLAGVAAARDALRAAGDDVRLIFLEANTETLVKRFSETRRRHPLSEGSRTLAECIVQERELLEPVGAIAHRIDTSNLSANALRSWVRDLASIDRSRLTLLFESFGYKNGIPLDADLVFDVRFLANPHYDPLLQPLTGRDAPVIAFLDADPEAQHLLDDIRGFVAKWLPGYTRDHRSYLTVAIGCTGGRHRSVYLCERLAQAFRGDSQVLVRHRDV